MFVVENTGQLMTLRWSRYHVTSVGVHRIANVWKRAVRSDVPRLPVVSVDRVRGRIADVLRRIAMDRPGEDSRVVPVALEHVDFRRADAQGAVVSSSPRPGVRHQPKRGPGPVPLCELHPGLEVPVPEDLPRGKRRRGDVARVALGAARDEVEDPVSHVLAPRRRRGVPPLVVVPHATPKPRERVSEHDAVPATGDWRGRPRRRRSRDDSRGRFRRLEPRARALAAEHTRIEPAL